jgi:hypothetical protein
LVFIGVDRRSSAANPLPRLPGCRKCQVRSDSATFPAILADLHSCVAHPSTGSAADSVERLRDLMDLPSLVQQVERDIVGVMRN